MKTIGIGISTVTENIDRAVSLAKKLESYGNKQLTKVVVLSQRESKEECISLLENTLLVKSRDSGLSKSRNYMIQALDTDFLWLIDDDVEITVEELNKVVRLLSDDVDIAVGKIRCSDTAKKKYYKHYRARNGINGLLRSSSIEMIIKSSFLDKHKLTFNECMGIGAKYPCGEENEFLLRCHKSGANVRFLDEIIIGHPCKIKREEPFAYFRLPQHIDARILILKQLSGFYAIKYSLKVAAILLLKVKSMSLFSYFLRRLIRELNWKGK